MKARLIFFACAFLALGLLAYHLQPKDGDTANAVVAAAATPASESAGGTVKVDSAPEQSSGTKSRTSASAPAGASGSGAPSTEASALGYLQTASRRSWDLRRDDFSNSIRTLSGGELDSKSIVPRQAGDQFVKFYSQGLFGVDPARVKFNREEVTDRTRLIYDQVVDGVLVYGGSLSLFFENGALTRVQNDLAPFEIEAGSKPAQVSQAFSSYKTVQASFFDVALQDHVSNKAILYPNGHSLVYAYEFITSENDKGASSAVKSYHVLYDAADKFVIERRPSAIR